MAISLLISLMTAHCVASVTLLISLIGAERVFRLVPILTKTVLEHYDRALGGIDPRCDSRLILLT
jgi:sorbitol-specific phosphotransferase system component IIC